MSNSITINCISGVMPPARCISAGMQLVCAKRGGHISKISNIISKITHFIYRFIQCSQNTVVSLMRGIQHCILFKDWQDNTCGRLAISDGIICAQKNRKNIHEYLTKIKKSEENIQYSNRYNMIETSMDNNFKNANNFKNENNFKNKNTNKTSGRKHYFLKMISGITKVSFLHCPQYFFN